MKYEIPTKIDFNLFAGARDIIQIYKDAVPEFVKVKAPIKSASSSAPDGKLNLSFAIPFDFSYINHGIYRGKQVVPYHQDLLEQEISWNAGGEMYDYYTLQLSFLNHGLHWAAIKKNPASTEENREVGAYFSANSNSSIISMEGLKIYELCTIAAPTAEKFIDVVGKMSNAENVYMSQTGNTAGIHYSIRQEMARNQDGNFVNSAKKVLTINSIATLDSGR